LVQRARRGDPEAFECLYEASFDKIYRYISFKVRQQQDAEDLTQQVFMKAMESIGSFRWRGVSFSAWLFRIAHNQIVDFYRRNSRRNTVPLEDNLAIHDSGPYSDPEAMAERNWQIEELSQACLQLTPAQREVISLRFAGELSVAETAQTVGKSQGAVKVMQHEALRKLRQIMLPVTEEMDGQRV